MPSCPTAPANRTRSATPILCASASRSARFGPSPIRVSRTGTPHFQQCRDRLDKQGLRFAVDQSPDAQNLRLPVVSPGRRPRCTRPDRSRNGRRGCPSSAPRRRDRPELASAEVAYRHRETSRVDLLRRPSPPEILELHRPVDGNAPAPVLPPNRAASHATSLAESANEAWMWRTPRRRAAFQTASTPRNRTVPTQPPPNTGVGPSNSKQERVEVAARRPVANARRGATRVGPVAAEAKTGIGSSPFLQVGVGERYPKSGVRWIENVSTSTPQRRSA